MGRSGFVASAFLAGGVLLTWSALPWRQGQDAFYAFIYFCGPGLVFTLMVVTLAASRYRNWQGTLLLPASPFIYYTGGHVLFRDEIYGWGSPFMASLLTALVYLSLARVLIFQNCPWSLVLKWVPLSLAAGLPFVHPLFRLYEDSLGNFWFWGLHVFLWYLAVGFVLDRMASVEQAAR